MNEAVQNVPRHVAIIMDGNGRWASHRAMTRHVGHRAGIKAVRTVVETASLRGVQYLTLFAFSSENWARPREEVSALMKLFFEALQREVEDLHRNKVRLRFIGALDQLQPALVDEIRAAERLTADNGGLELLIAVAYGGRWDLVNAAQELAAATGRGEIEAKDIDEQALADKLQLAGVPDPDLLIRTGGEQRISNFLLWNLAYAELWFSDKLWPDFDATDFERAIDHFAGRQRRFGHTGDQVGVAS